MRIHPSYFDLYLTRGLLIIIVGVIVFVLPDIISEYGFYEWVPEMLTFQDFSLLARLLGIGIIIAGHLYIFLIQRTTYLDIKPNMIEYKSGILFWKISKVPYETITDTQVTRSPLNLLLDTGNLLINTSGKDGYEIVFRGALMDDLRIVEHEIRERRRIQKKKDEDRNNGDAGDR
ncbi:MAG: PH domain-containing protein [Candidatus Micrarchaeota archaeon]|nr:PH domain-containing protein [Candidatus Micrarchaeota archaeon]